MGENLPVLHDREKPTAEPQADSEAEAVYISVWERRVQAIGNEDKDEWLLSDVWEDLDEMV